MKLRYCYNKLCNYLFFTIAALLISACANNLTTVRHSAIYSPQDLKKGQIIILPTEASVSMVDTFGSTERMENYEYHIESIIDHSALSALKEQGYDVVLLSKKDLVDRKISGKALQFKDQYNEAIKTVYESCYLDKEKAFAIDNKVGSINELNTGAKKKYILLCHYTGSSQTTGARVTNILIDALIGSRLSSNAESTNLLIGITDNSNSKFYWSNVYATADGVFTSAFQDNDTKDQKHSDDLVKSILKPMDEEKKQ